MSTEAAAIRRSIRTLSQFRTACLLGEDDCPKSVTVDGFTFHDELEAEGYLAELGQALRELEDAT
jgi:hypothetical protein